MYDYVCTCSQTSLHCTAHHHCTARLGFFIFLLETSTIINKETAFRSFHSLGEFSISTPALGPLAPPEPLGQTSVDEVQPGTQVMDNSWALRGAEMEIHTATWRPGDLATWPAKRRAAPSEDEPGATGSTTQKLPKPLFEISVSEIFCLKMFEIF